MVELCIKTLRSEKLTGKKGNKTELTGKRPLRRRSSALDCSATEEEASGQDRLCNIFKDITSLLKGTSMTHIILIDEYLYSRYRELLSV
jgi:hypothetical protein